MFTGLKYLAILMNMRSISALVFLLSQFSFQLLFAQFEILENNPPDIIWQQINTPHFKIIHDRNIADKAQHVANTMESLYHPVSQSLSTQPKKISIILQNYNSISNGFVSQAPRRSEFYGTPPQDYNFLGVLNWLDLLAVHEFRHVVQFDKSVTRFNKFLHYVFGYEISSSMAHIAVPEWFWEGDAVNIETALTRGGRGRIPNFGILFKTNTLERKRFDYHRQYLRSFKYNIQDHYVFGHFFTAYLRNRYGKEVIDKVTEQTWSWPFLPFRFSNRLKKHTGNSLISNYNDLMDDLEVRWKQQLEDREFTQFKTINIRKQKAYTDFLYPHYLRDGSILALKRGIGDISTFVVFDEEGDHDKLFIPGVLNDGGMISVGTAKIAWNEFEFDPRYRKNTYSVIKTYDLNTGKIQKVTKKSRYSSAALSPDDKKIVTVETAPDLNNSLVIINTNLGWDSHKIPNPENHLFIHPRWSYDGQYIVSVRKGKEGKTIMIYHVETGEITDLWPMRYENIGYPIMYKSFILYNSSYDGIDNIYAFSLLDKRKYRVTSSKYGAYNPQISWDGTSIIYNEFSKDGHDIVEIEFKPNDWVAIEDVRIDKDIYVETLKKQEGDSNVLSTVDTIKYPSERYRIINNIINPYAWGPYITGTDLEFFVGIKSQDVMSTTSMNLGYQLNAIERTGRWLGNITYQGLYPALSLTGYSGNRKVQERFPVIDEEGTIVGDTTVDISWKERGLEAGFRIPLILTQSRFFQNLNLGFNYNYTNVRDYDFIARYFDMQGNGNLFSNRYFISYNRLLKRSKRDINSRLGQTLFLSYEHTPYGGDYLSGLFAGEFRLFLPGFFKHHSLQLQSSYWNQETDHGDKTYLLSSPIMFTRGYSYQFYESYWNNGINYALPLLYPDLNIGSLLNIQRIYTNLFFDMGISYQDSNRQYFRSFGADLNFDFNVMRFITRLNAGVRYIYAIDDPVQVHKFQILVGSFGF